MQRFEIYVTLNQAEKCEMTTQTTDNFCWKIEYEHTHTKSLANGHSG